MTDSSSVHVPVLLDAVIQWLDPRPGMVMVDGTLGGGGHTQALLERVGANGLVIALDRDPDVIDKGQQKFQGMPIRLAQANFCDLPEVLEQLNIKTSRRSDIGFGAYRAINWPMSNGDSVFRSKDRSTCDLIRRRANRPGD